MGDGTDDDGDRSTDSSWSVPPQHRLRRAVIRPLRTVPLELLVAVGVAAVASLETAGSLPSGLGVHFANDWIVTSIPVFLGLLATSSLYFFGVIGRRARWAISAVYIAGGVLYGMFVLGPTSPYTPERAPEMYRWALLTAALGLGNFLVPLAAREGPSRTRALVGEYSVRFLRRFAMAAVFGVVLFAGLVGAYGAVTSLFGLSYDPDFVAHALAWILGAAAPGVFVAGLPSIARPEPEELDGLQSRALTLAGNWLFTPLAGLYLVILYVYEARILWTGEAPKNLLSPLALGAAIVVIIGLFLLDHLRHTERGRRLVDRIEWIPVAYAPVIPMPIWAIGVRIHQHGWTEFRYVRMLASVGVAVAFSYAAVAKLRGKSPSVQVLPATFAAVCLLGSVGPWSVVDLPRWSQSQHLRAELDRAGALEDGAIRDLEPGRAAELDSELVQNIQSRARYLDDRYGRSALQNVADSGLDSDAQHPVAALGVSALAGVEASGTEPTARGGPSRAGDGPPIVHVSFDDTWSFPGAPRIRAVHRLGSVELGGEKPTVEVEPNGGDALEADVSPLVDRVEERAPLDSTWIHDLPESAARLPLVDGAGVQRGTLVVRSLDLVRRPGGAFDAQSCRAVAFLHRIP